MAGELVLTLTTILSDSPHAGMPFEHVRSSNPVLAARLLEVFERSETARIIIQSLSRSDAIVYVEDGRCTMARPACTSVRRAPNGQRYIRVTVRQTEKPHVLAGLIGHEIQHALEIASTAISDDH